MIFQPKAFSDSMLQPVSVVCHHIAIHPQVCLSLELSVNFSRVSSDSPSIPGMPLVSQLPAKTWAADCKPVRSMFQSGFYAPFYPLIQSVFHLCDERDIMGVSVKVCLVNIKAWDIMDHISSIQEHDRILHVLQYF